MTLEEFVDSLNLPIEGKYLNNEYRIQVNSSNELTCILYYSRRKIEWLKI